MTVKEKLLQQFEAAINATFGDRADEDYDKYGMTKADLLAVTSKVTWYLDL